MSDIEELDRLLNTKNVPGDPIEKDRSTVIPIVSYGFGFGVGGTQDAKAGDGGGTGGGAGIKPIGRITLDAKVPASKPSKALCRVWPRSSEMQQPSPSTRRRRTDRKKRPEMALQVLLWIGVSQIVLVIFLVITPIHVMLSWQNDPAKRATVLLRLFGGVSPKIKVYDSTRPSKPDKPARKRRKRKRRQTGRQRWNLRGDILPDAVTLLRRVFGAIHIDLLHVDAEVSLGDPAETGQLYGQLCPLIYTTGGHVTLRLNFERPCL